MKLWKKDKEKEKEKEGNEIICSHLSATSGEGRGGGGRRRREEEERK